MLRIPGQLAKDVCDRNVGLTRRDLLRVGGSSMLGLSLANVLELKKRAANSDATSGSGPGWNKAKSVIMVYLQGGPSHLDLWDPKENVPDNVQQRVQADSHQAARRATSPRCCRSWRR